MAIATGLDKIGLFSLQPEASEETHSQEHSLKGCCLTPALKCWQLPEELACKDTVSLELRLLD